MIHIVWWKWNSEVFRNRGANNCIYEHDVPMYMDAFPENSQTVYLDGFQNLPANTGAIVVLNGAVVKAVDVELLNHHISQMPWVVVLSMQDDNSRLPLHSLRHPNMKIWVHSPKPGLKNSNECFSWAMPNHDYARRIPVGYTKMFRNLSSDIIATPRTLDWLFIGRVGYSSRQDWFAALKSLIGNKFSEPAVFAHNERRIWSNEGVFGEVTIGNLPASEEQYVSMTCSAKVIICRPASCTPETGRLYEALEAKCVPIVSRCAPDNWNEVYNWENYWEYVFGETPPFPIINGPDELESAIQKALHDWPSNVNHIYSWWTDYKQRLFKTLKEEVRELQLSAKRTIL